MTSMAVTAIICASASEVALLVASFMPFSLDSGLGDPDMGAFHRGPQRPDNRLDFTRNTPRRVFALIESPLSEHRRGQGRLAIRRHFGSPVAGLCARQGILEAARLAGASGVDLTFAPRNRELASECQIQNSTRNLHLRGSL